MNADEDRTSKVVDTGEGAVITVGTFDGIHIGHQTVLDCVVKDAKRKFLKGIVLTFQTHPLQVLRPSEAPRLLTTLEEKVSLLTRFGIDGVEIIPFTPEFSRLSPVAFVRDYLSKKFQMVELVIGYDHGFGHGRQGSVAVLRSIADELGFQLVVVDPVKVDSQAVSSSRIREAIGRGDLDYTGRALGRPYSFLGRVVRGDGRGRDIGFPTANLALSGHDKLLPPDGVYAVQVELKGEAYAGMLHQGKRPPFERAARSIEVHLIDFEGDILNESLEVGYLKWIRPIERFVGPDELRAQLEKDREYARSTVRLR
ncbi:MAG: riboflavin biosynthesis protein RibF [Candidatus Glassbacteria bacterium RBG_16_58_8]|uniref:Riboflavin biosynthesis protein n=1 Tax=Candidatus Glassbacteria bacterium RBG_16_58_8 TaxID=1817866 RepID=A0A1F5YD44_9BACT|nr:MAG: riboflavin biosynthesis protein RibF [Candidatus Glassbacteria bacterium RBG_16_58_8]